MTSRRTLLILLLSLAVQPAFCQGQFYKWLDEEGTVHMTDNLSQVPPRYRAQIDKKSVQPGLPLQPESVLNGKNEPAAGLNHFVIPYKAFEGNARRIIIPVTLNDSVHSNLLLDTGSPGLMISPDLASRLGLPDEQHGALRVIAGGVGGSTKAVFAVVDTIRVGEARSEFLPVTIAEIPSGEFEGLVGMDFMANYRVAIDIKNDLVVFDELPPHTNRPGGHDEAWWRSNFLTFTKFRTDWEEQLEKIDSADSSSSESERRRKIAEEQYEAADQLFRKLERYARDNAVPIDWRR